MTRSKYSQTGIVLGVALLGALTGCIGYVDRQPHAGGYSSPPGDYMERDVVVLQDEYVYYPGYQVYYNDNRREYVYLDGRSWVSRPAPPRVPVDVLVASPSVRLAFHDSPAIHHASVVRQYPKHWAPPGQSPDHREGERVDGNDYDRGRW